MSRIRMLVGGLVLVSVVVFGTSATAGLRIVNAQKSKTTEPEKSTSLTYAESGKYPYFSADVIIDGEVLEPCSGRRYSYLAVPLGKEYEIILRNRTGDRVAVALFVDGLNTIDASQTSAWEASKWLIGPHQTITITGWQMSSDRARKFYFTTERDSYAAKLDRKADFGYITAVFFHEKHKAIVVPPPDPRDIYQPQNQTSSAEASSTGAKSSRRTDQAATGIGRSVRHDVRYVDLDLESRPAGQVSIRYESRTFAPDPENIAPCKRDN